MNEEKYFSDIKKPPKRRLLLNSDFPLLRFSMTEKTTNVNIFCVYIKTLQKEFGYNANVD